MLKSVANAETSQNEIPYLFITPVIAPMGFSEFEKQQINKLVVKGSARQTSYQVIIGTPSDTKKFKWQLHEINVVVSKESDEFQVLAVLKDARKELVINSIHEANIPLLELYRRIEDIINRLFLPVEKILVSEVKPKTPKSISEASIEAEEIIKTNINFRERIMNLQTDVNIAVSQASALKDKPKEPVPLNKELLNDKKVTNNSTNSESQLELPNNTLPPFAPKPKQLLPLDIGHSVRIGYYTFKTNSRDNKLDTDSNPKYILLDYEYARSWAHQSHFYHHFNLRYGRNINKEEKEFSPYTGAALLEGYFFESLGWMPKAGLEIDTISFKNLPEIGQGLKIANNQIYWLNVSSVNSFKMFLKNFRFSISYGHPLKLKSDYSGLDKNPSLMGRKINATIAMLNLYKKYHLEINYFNSQIEASSKRVITFNTSGVGLNAFFNF